MKEKEIPKVIHYCWFGGKPFDKLSIKCIDSWKKYCPDYEIKLWDESNFNFDSCEYSRKAYHDKKWAFVSDYARCKILYEYGGVYLDTDVELIKPLNDLIMAGPYMGIETERITVNPGLGMAAYPKMEFFRKMVNYYESNKFGIDRSAINNYKTIVDITTEFLKKDGMVNKNVLQVVNDIAIYPKTVLNPYNFDTCRFEISKDTISIHHYAASWTSRRNKFNTMIFKIIARCKSIFRRNK